MIEKQQYIHTKVGPQPRAAECIMGCWSCGWSACNLKGYRQDNTEDQNEVVPYTRFLELQ